MIRSRGLAGRTGRLTACIATTLIVLAVTLVADCSADTSDSTTHLVLMGDSFSSGVGLPDTESGDPGCGRSRSNYAQLYAATARAAGHDVQVKDAACGGATTVQYTSAQKSGVPAQLSALSTSTDEVMMTIGANDINWDRIITYCLTPDANNAQICDTGLSFAENMVGDGSTVSSPLGGMLVTALTAVAARTSPTATIVLVGYPHLEGDPQMTVSGGGLTVAAGARTRALLVHLQSLGMAAVAAANTATNSGRFQFVGTMAAFDGPPYHGLTTGHAGKNRWLISHEDNYRLAFHPNAAGHAAIAALLTAQVPLPGSTVASGPAPVTIATTRFTAHRGRHYAARLRTTDRAAGSWKILSGSLPKGLHRKGSHIWGRPTKLTTRTLRVRFTGRDGRVTTARVMLRVTR